MEVSSWWFWLRFWLTTYWVCYPSPLVAQNSSDPETIASQLNFEERAWLWIARKFGVGWLADYHLDDVNEALAARNMSLSTGYIRTSVNRGLLSKISTEGDYGITTLGDLVIDKIVGISTNLNDQRLDGFVLSPMFVIAPSSLVTLTTEVGRSSQKTFIVTNPGRSPLSISNIIVAGVDAPQFSVTPTTVSIPSGASAVFTILHTPSASGEKSASLAIFHDAAGSPLQIVLTALDASL